MLLCPDWKYLGLSADACDRKQKRTCIVNSDNWFETDNLACFFLTLPYACASLGFYKEVLWAGLERVCSGIPVLFTGWL
jgi:hypothetical protein